MADNRFKIVVYVSHDRAPDLREAMTSAGAGVIGDYTHCTFTTSGMTRFRPTPGAQPTTGHVGELVEVVEDRIETICSGDKLDDVVKAVRAAHPNEEPAMDVYAIHLV